MKNLLSEIYLGNLEELNPANGYHKIVKAFSKLAKTNKLYEDSRLMSQDFVNGYTEAGSVESEVDLCRRLILSPKQIPCGYSRKAISIACKESKMALRSTMMRQNLLKSDLNCFLDSRSKVTSSVKDRTVEISENMMTMLIKNLEDGKYGDNQELLSHFKSGVRAKVIVNLLAEIESHMLMGMELTVFHVAAKFISSLEDVFNGIAEKLQIGAVRELMIQDIKSAMGTHVLETISIAACYNEPEEMLTKKDKFQIQVKNARSLIKSGRVVINKLADSAQWGPRVMPTEFMPMFNYLRDTFGNNIINGAQMMLTKMTHKLLEIPKHVWKKFFTTDFDPNRLPTPERSMYEELMATGQIVFINRNNMGQGILHFTSSLKHSMMFHLIRKVQKQILGRVCDFFEQRRQCGSDDSAIFTAVMVNIVGLLIYAVLEEIDECVRRLFNIEENGVKTVSGTPLSEYNSNFEHNGSCEPIEDKFVIVATRMPSVTDYDGTMRNALSNVRNTMFNATSLSMATLLIHQTSNFVRSIFQVSDGKRNDPSAIFNIENWKIPLQLCGPCQIAAISLYACGPDIVNLKLHNYAKKTSDQKMLSMLEWVYTPMSLLETSASSLYVNPDLLTSEVVSRKVKIVLRTDGVVTKMRSNLKLSKSKIDEHMKKNPFLPFLPAISSEESAIKLTSVLYTKGVENAFSYKSTASDLPKAIAAATLRKFIVPTFSDDESEDIRPKLMSLKECLEKIHGDLIPPRDSVHLLSMICGFSDRFDDFESWLNSTNYGTFWIRHNYRTTIRQTEMRSAGIKLHNPITDILFSLWFNEEFNKRGMKIKFPRKLTSDRETLQRKFPFIKDSMKETVLGMGLAENDDSNIRVVNAVMHCLMKNTTKQMYHYRCGPSEPINETSWVNMLQFNCIPGMRLVGGKKRTKESDYPDEIVKEVLIISNDDIPAVNLSFVFEHVASAFGFVFEIVRINEKFNMLKDWARNTMVTFKTYAGVCLKCSVWTILKDISYSKMHSTTTTRKSKNLLLLAKAYVYGDLESLRELLARTEEVNVKWIMDQSRISGSYDKSSASKAILTLKGMSLVVQRYVKGDLPHLSFRMASRDRTLPDKLEKLIKTAAILFGYSKSSNRSFLGDLPMPKNWDSAEFWDGEEKVKGIAIVENKGRFNYQVRDLSRFMRYMRNCQVLYEDALIIDEPIYQIEGYTFFTSEKKLALMAIRFEECEHHAIDVLLSHPHVDRLSMNYVSMNMTDLMRSQFRRRGLDVVQLWNLKCFNSAATVEKVVADQFFGTMVLGDMHKFMSCITLSMIKIVRNTINQSIIRIKNETKCKLLMHLNSLDMKVNVSTRKKEASRQIEEDEAPFFSNSEIESCTFENHRDEAEFDQMMSDKSILGTESLSGALMRLSIDAMSDPSVMRSDSGMILPMMISTLNWCVDNHETNNISTALKFFRCLRKLSNGVANLSSCQGFFSSRQVEAGRRMNFATNLYEMMLISSLGSMELDFSVFDDLETVDKDDWAGEFNNRFDSKEMSEQERTLEENYLNVQQEEISRSISKHTVEIEDLSMEEINHMSFGESFP